MNIGTEISEKEEFQVGEEVYAVFQGQGPVLAVKIVRARIGAVQVSKSEKFVTVLYYIVGIGEPFRAAALFRTLPDAMQKASNYFGC